MNSDDVEHLSPPHITVGKIFAMFWRHRLFIVCLTVAGAILSIAFVSAVAPKYKAEGLVLIDTRKKRVTNIESILSSPYATADTTLIKSEVEILQSDDLSRHVIAQLGLLGRPEFEAKPSLAMHIRGFVADGVKRVGVWGGDDALASRVQEWLGGDAAAAADAASGNDTDRRMSEAVAEYEKRLRISNDGRSYIIRVGFESTDPVLAANITNAHAAAYLADQVNFKQEATHQALVFLGEQLADFQVRLRESELAVEQYREAQHLVTTRGGVTTANQQVGDLNAQLALVRAELAQKDARAAEIRAAARNPTALDGDREVLLSPLLARLREQEATLLRRQAELRAQLGERHPAMINMRAEVQDLRQKIADETGRIIQSASFDVQTARAREEQLRNALTDVELRSLKLDAKEVRLRELTREADSNRALYEHLLGRYKEILTQDGLQQPDALIISKAAVPLDPSYPKKHLIVGTSSGLFFVMGCLLSFLLERPRSVVMGLSELEATAALPALGSVPAMSHRNQKLLPPQDFPTKYPRSGLAEAINTLRCAIGKADLDEEARVLLFTSALPDEGKSMLALLYARNLASSGMRVLLIDADLRKPSIAHMAYGLRYVGGGLVGCLMQSLSLSDAVAKDEKTPLDLLLPEQAPPRPQDLLLPSKMAVLLAECRSQYDYVVIDSPPIAAVSDAILLGEAADQAIIVVRWNSTPHAVVRSAVKRLADRGIKCAGIVLNAVDVQRAKLDAGDFEAYYAKNRRYYEL